MKFIVKNFFVGLLVVFAIVVMSSTCKKAMSDTNDGTNDSTSSSSPGVSFWLTKGDQSVLLQKQNVDLTFGTTSNNYSTITVDSAQTFQSIDGFGYTLTGASAYLINH